MFEKNQKVVCLSKRILEFLTLLNSELPTNNAKFINFLERALFYLDRDDVLHGSKSEFYLREELLTHEPADKELFQFTYDPGFKFDGYSEYFPTIQISANYGRHHALIIKKSKQPLSLQGGYNHYLELGGDIRACHISDRNLSSRDVQFRYPEIHRFKRKCMDQRIPIIYILGSARQFPASKRKISASCLTWQKRQIDMFLGWCSAHYERKVIIGTGGWSGVREGSLGVPSLGYSSAKKNGNHLVTTMPLCGVRDRHLDSDFEFICGNEWGEDSPVLAQICDGAFILSPYGVWTAIEVTNLRRKKKPFVISRYVSSSDKAVVHNCKGSSYLIELERSCEDMFSQIDEKAICY